MKTYWSKCAYNKNFGDQLGPYILEKYTGHKPVWTKAHESKIVVVGSIAEHLPEQYKGIVAGIGLASKTTKKDFSKANVLALRGPLTDLRVISNQIPILADPGLLASEFVEEQEKEHNVGVILHYADRSNQIPGHQIKTTDPIETVIEQAAKCKQIVSSSLHGIILADSLGIPRKWVKYARIQGEGFKFYDYSLSLGLHIKPNEWVLAPQKVVETKKRELKEMFQCL